MPLKLRDRILGWSIATTLIIVLAVVLLVDNIFRNTIRDTLEESLRSGARLAGELQSSRMDAWITDVTEQTYNNVSPGAISHQGTGTLTMRGAVIQDVVQAAISAQ